jgi:acyl-[acyl-carrier-protein]-phospholipid O-acyltransferase/long-chain-fatty-acid--[acyl-carrier-protein] ligase
MSGPARSAHVAVGSPRFLAYLASQSLGALNDNAFKLTLVLFALGTAATDADKVRVSSVLTALFTLPWLVLSQPAGYLADRYRKDRVLLATKVPEMLLMGVGAAGFYLESLPLLCLTLVLMSAQSTLFSPAKYGILPEVLAPHDLSYANGVLSMTTNLAILAGTIVGVGMFDLFQGRLVWAGVVYMVLGAIGAVLSLYLPKAPPGTPHAPWPKQPIAQLSEDITALRRVPSLPSTVLGGAYFTFLGGVLLTVIPAYGIETLRLETATAGYLPLPLVLGIASGSVAAGRLSRGRVELGLVPLGAVLMTAAAFDMTVGNAADSVHVLSLPLRAVVDLAILGFGAGLFNVPLAALLQQRSPESERGRLIGVGNIASNIALLVAAGATYLLTYAPGFQVTYTLGALTIVTILGTAHIVWLLPDFLTRVVVYLLVSVLYRLRAVNLDAIPKGGALFAANHVSFVDGLVVAAASGRMVRFMMFRPIYEWPPLHWLFKALHVIPVEGGGDKTRNDTSLARARAEIEAGHTVCIFAEGAITRHGNLLGFRSGLERIAGGGTAPIIPVYLDGLWGSIFSFERGRVLLKWPRRFRHPIQVLFGEPLPPDTTAFRVRQAVQELAVDAIARRESTLRTLPTELLRSARRNPGRRLVTDADGRWLTYRDATRLALRMRDGLRARGVVPGEIVAIAVPDDVRGAIAHLAVVCAGAVPMHLPPSRGAAETALRDGEVRRGIALADGDAHTGLGTDVTWLPLRELAPRHGDMLEPAPQGERSSLARLQRAVSRRLPSTPAGRAFWSDVPRGLVLHALPLALSQRWLIGGRARAASDTACVVFTRGTGGRPRGVLLSHANVVTNIRALRQIFDFGREDTLLGTASLSHGLGVTGTLWLPIYAGASVSLAGPLLESDAVERLARATLPTLLFASPGILARYVAEIDRGALASIETVVVGGRTVSERLRAAFSERFDAELLEAYGMSECAPLVAINIRDPRAGGGAQRGNRPGTLGHPLPGVAVSVCDPATGEVLPADHEGVLLVRGPNVMSGYLGDAASGLLPGGWHRTGDIVRMDREGFLTFVDREEQLVHHAAGDIPLSRIEALVHAACDRADDFELDELCCVTALDADGAPAVAVAYLDGKLVPDAVRDALASAGLPAHWLPERAAFVPVRALPRHETGHLDRAAAAKIARSAARRAG